MAVVYTNQWLLLYCVVIGGCCASDRRCSGSCVCGPGWRRCRRSDQLRRGEQHATAVPTVLLCIQCKLLIASIAPCELRDVWRIDRAAGDQQETLGRFHHSRIRHHPKGGTCASATNEHTSQLNSTHNPSHTIHVNYYSRLFVGWSMRWCLTDEHTSELNSLCSHNPTELSLEHMNHTHGDSLMQSTSTRTCFPRDWLSVGWLMWWCIVR